MWTEVLILVLLTQESAGDVFRHLVTRATHLRQVGELSVQHPLKLQQKESNQRHESATLSPYFGLNNAALSLSFCISTCGFFCHSRY